MRKTSATPVDLSTAATDQSRTMGGILVEKGRLSTSDVDEIRRFAHQEGLRFGDAAVRLNLLTQDDVEFALAKQFKYPILARGGDGGVSDDVIAAYRPHSEMVEELRALRSQLLLCGLQDAPRKILAIASAERGDGRSWLAANLATVLAQNGTRTLLIDADMRHPRQHEIFNLSNAVGLSALLTGRAGREIVSRIHPQLRLFVAPAGIPPPNPQELLGRDIFRAVLDRYTDQFDVIVLDTPAVTEAADAQILAARAGATLMLARRHHTHHSNLSAAMQRFRDTGVNVIGSIINNY